MSSSQSKFAIELPDVPRTKINFADQTELMCIQGVGHRLAASIVELRESHGNLDPKLLAVLSRRLAEQNVLKRLDFTPNPRFAQGKIGDVETAALGEAGSLPDLERVTELLRTQLKREIKDMEKSLTNKKALTQSHPGQPRVVEDVGAIPAESIKNNKAKTVPGKYSTRTKKTGKDKLRRNLDFEYSDDISSDDAKVPGHRMSSSSDDEPKSTARRGKGGLAIKGRHSRTKIMLPTDESDSESESDYVPTRRGRKSKAALKSLPKLSFDGKGDWEIFQEKFQDYAEQMDWTPSESKTCLKWCLAGKAAKFCKSIMKTNEDITYKKLMKKLNDRFGDDDLRAAAHAQFNQATQEKNESMEDWADRVQELASKAFKNLPDDYCRSQAVERFCEGMLDSEAGHNVIMQEPTTLEQALKRKEKLGM